MGGVRDFYGKRALRRTSQSNGARGCVCGKAPYCERRLLAKRILQCGIGRELLRIVLRGQRLFSELLLRKDGGTAGCIRDTRTDTRGHGGTRVYRRQAIAETGWLRYWLRHWAGLNWVLHAEEAGSGIRDTCV